MPTSIRTYSNERTLRARAYPRGGFSLFWRTEMVKGRPGQSRGLSPLRSFFTLCALEAGLLVICLTWYRSNYKPDLSTFLSSPPGWIFLIATVGSCALALHLVRQCRLTSPASTRSLLLVNLACVAGLVGIGEVVLRALAVRDLGGEHIGSLNLRPRGWEAVVGRYTKIIDDFESRTTFFVGDPQLGWTIGTDRRSDDGLAYSSTEGVRSPAPGVSYLREPVVCRIAIVGDSFAFAEEVRYEESWGAFLEQQLGQRCQVLNFAVGGHSIGQMYLHFERDVLQWKPDVVILAFSDGAISRTMGVYCFLVMTDWDCPWGQPRFVFNGQGLKIVNDPLASPRQIFSSAAIRDVPYILQDRWYRPSEWEQAHWDWAYHSYVFRWLTSLYPLHNISRSQVSDEAMEALNEALFSAFIRLAHSNGVAPMLVYLPVSEEYEQRPQAPITHSILKRTGIDLLDMTPCLAKVPRLQRFVTTDVHYSAAGNEAIARCVMPSVLRALGDVGLDRLKAREKQTG